MNLMYKEAGKYRLEFSRIIKNGIPYLRVIDNYGYPLIVNEYLFEYKGVKDLRGYGAKMIDDIIEIISLASKTAIGHRDFIAKKGIGDMGLLNRALEDVQSAMENFDDTTGSKSGFMFHTEPKKGEVLTITTHRFNSKLFTQNKIT
jgi:hypothetical protein